MEAQTVDNIRKITVEEVLTEYRKFLETQKRV